MATITSLELQRRRTDQVNVFLDDEFAFSLSLDLAADLHRGQELDDNHIRALQTEDAYRYALRRSMDLLARRPRSAVEIRRALHKQGVADAAAERVTERLLSLGYVDDEAFATWWVENRLAHRPRGRWALRRELGDRGVADVDIAAALAGVDDDELATDLALRRAPRYRDLDRDGLRRVLGGYLRRRGFTFESVNQALDAAWRHSRPLDEDGTLS